MHTDTIDPADGIHRADPLARRTAFVGVLTSVALGALLLWWLRGWLDALPMHAPGSLDALLWSVFAATLLVCAVCLAAAAMLWRIAGTTVEEQRFPPAGLRTVRDVPVRRGPASRRIAQACRIAAALVVLLAFGVLAWTAWAMQALA